MSGPVRAALLTWLAVAALALGACAADPDFAVRDLRKVAPCGEADCPSDCSKLRGPNCDIRNNACQRRVFRAAECVWGFDGELPPVQVIDEDELLEVYFGEPGEPNPLEGVWDRALQLLHLQDASVGGLEANQRSVQESVAAFYFGSTDEVFVVDRGMPLDDDWSLIVLAHEFIHALQFRQDAKLAEDRVALAYDLDRSAAFRMAVEGDATVHEDLAWSLLTGVSLSVEGQADHLRARLSYAQQQVFEADSPFVVLNSLAYPVGGIRLWDRWVAGESATLATRDELPKHVVQWMRPPGEAPMHTPLRCDTPDAPPGGYLDFSVSELGADVLFAFWASLRPADDADPVLDLQPTWLDAARQRRSRIRIFATDSLEVAVAWRIGFESESMARRFADEAQGQGTWRVDRDGDEVVLRLIDGLDDPAVLANDWPLSCPDWLPLDRRVQRLDEFEALSSRRKSGRRGSFQEPPVFGPDPRCVH